jgi:hypothetical protein
LYTFLSALYQLSWLVVGLDDVTRHDTTRSRMPQEVTGFNLEEVGLEGCELYGKT